MFFRRSLTLFCIGIGIGSPWLFRDWLASHSTPKAGLVSKTEPGWVERFREKLRPYTEDSVPLETPEIAEEGEREPYPLASQTRRIVESFLGGAGNRGGIDLGDFLPGNDSPPSTSRSLAITEETQRNLGPELAKLHLRCGNPVVLRLFKEEAELEIWMKPENDPHFTLFKVYRIVASAGRPGPKLREGDGQAPEGFYTVTSSALRPETKHHLGIDFGYPNELDRSLGRSGSDLTIHAGANAAGAFALSPAAMNEVYTLTDAAFRNGQDEVAIHLFPFRLTDARMDRVVAESSRWTDGWVNLKEGYDFFENVRLPPAVDMESGAYAFRIAAE